MSNPTFETFDDFLAHHNIDNTFATFEDFLVHYDLGGTFDTVEDFLEHYGIKGMKWGIRRANPSAGGTSAAAKSERVVSEDYARYRSSLSKHPSELSNNDMQALISRMNLEKTYAQLTAKPAPPPGKIAQLTNFVKDSALSVGRSQTDRILKEFGSVAMENVLNGRTMNGTDYARAIGYRVTPKEFKPKNPYEKMFDLKTSTVGGSNKKATKAAQKSEKKK